MVLYATEPAAADGEPALPAWTAVSTEECDSAIEARWRTEGHRIAELLAAEIGDYADIEHRF
ncbi:hypothetical protein [Gordonia sp. N1V]|uniref:hypothetical protein n=1 Tax=Gordonia sp. N1V TaxID=3034163 RepID=UPI0023E1CD81|nr:hypothetical protein [Gordonia sp. N1V]MDF3283078.1 hypothetical protein [Gordonia sp. N1V]